MRSQAKAALLHCRHIGQQYDDTETESRKTPVTRRPSVTMDTDE